MERNFLITPSTKMAKNGRKRKVEEPKVPVAPPPIEDEDEEIVEHARDAELADEDWYDDEDEEGEKKKEDADSSDEELNEEMSEDEETELDEEFLTNGKRKEDVLLYVDPNVLLADIKDYYNTNVFSKRLADSLFNIATKMSNRANFCGYSWKEEMILDGYEKMAMAIYNKKFDITRNYSPFSYLSRICWRCFVLRIKQEKRHKEEEREYRERSYDRIKAENTGIKFTDEMVNGERMIAPEQTSDPYEDGEDDWN